MENDSMCMNRLLHEKNDFAKVSKNLSRYKFKNNFVEPAK